MPFSKERIFFISEGDQKEFRQLVNSSTDFLLQIAINVLKNKELAEEAVSDVFINIWENRHRLTEIQNIKAYLIRCVKNACINQLRTNRSINNISIDSIEEYLHTENTNNNFEHQDAAQQIHDAINLLPPRCRLAFSLVKVNGMRYSEVAIIMNISEKTVNNHLVFAVKKIKESLGVNNKCPGRYNN